MSSTFSTHGALSWHELSTSDTEQAMTFYHQVFGWQFKTVQFPQGPYYIIENKGTSIGGISNNPCPTLPSHWTGYVTVDDIDKVALTAKALGGQILYGPEDIADIGRFCWFKDPQGAVIAAISYYNNNR